MLTMARSRKTKPKSDQSSEKPQVQEDENKPISFRLDPDLRRSLTQFRESQRIPPTATDCIVVAIQEFLQREGFWPPKPPKSEKS